MYARVKSMIPLAANHIIVEVLEADGRHRMFRGFTVPMNKYGKFTSFEEVETWIKTWGEMYPGHTFVMHLKPNIGELYNRGN